jgi:hypothetical protein
MLIKLLLSKWLTLKFSRLMFSKLWLSLVHVILMLIIGLGLLILLRNSIEICRFSYLFLVITLKFWSLKIFLIWWIWKLVLMSLIICCFVICNFSGCFLFLLHYFWHFIAQLIKLRAIIIDTFGRRSTTIQIQLFKRLIILLITVVQIIAYILKNRRAAWWSNKVYLLKLFCCI